MVLVDQMVVGPLEWVVFDFLHSRKAKTSCSFEFNCFSFNHTFFLRTRQVRFLARSEERDLFYLMDVSGSIPERWVWLKRKQLLWITTCWFAFFFIREKRKPAVLFNSIIFFFFIQSYILLKDASGSIPGASRKATFGICFKMTSQVRFLKDGVWLSR